MNAPKVIQETVLLPVQEPQIQSQTFCRLETYVVFL